MRQKLIYIAVILVLVVLLILRPWQRREKASPEPTTTQTQTEEATTTAAETTAATTKEETTPFDELTIDGDNSAANAAAVVVNPFGEQIARTAESCLGIGYRAGGITPEEGFDEWTFVDYCVFQAQGVHVGTKEETVIAALHAVPDYSVARGDIVYLEDDGILCAVGIITGDSTFIYCEAGVMEGDFRNMTRHPDALIRFGRVG